MQAIFGETVACSGKVCYNEVEGSVGGIAMVEVVAALIWETGTNKFMICRIVSPQILTHSKQKRLRNIDSRAFLFVCSE